jgi:hypothetical protein
MRLGTLADVHNLRDGDGKFDAARERGRTRGRPVLAHAPC